MHAFWIKLPLSTYTN